MLWLEQHLSVQILFMPPPATEGLFGRGEGCTLFGIDLVGVDHDWNWPRGARHFLCAYHMNQVSGLGPHLHEYK